MLFFSCLWQQKSLEFMRDDWQHIGRWIENLSFHIIQFILSITWLVLWMEIVSHTKFRVCSLFLYAWRKQKWNTKVGSTTVTRGLIGRNKALINFFPLINYLIWDLRFLQRKESLLCQCAGLVKIDLIWGCIQNIDPNIGSFITVLLLSTTQNLWVGHKYRESKQHKYSTTYQPNHCEYRTVMLWINLPPTGNIFYIKKPKFFWEKLKGKIKITRWGFKWENILLTEKGWNCLNDSTIKS